MSLLRRVLAGLGVLAAVAGFAFAVDRGLAASVTLGEALLIPVGLAALFQGYRTLKDRKRASLSFADPGDPETEQDLPVPGDGFDDRLASLSGAGATAYTGGYARYAGRDHVVRTRDAVEERIETAAVATLRRRLGCTDEDARELLASGDWTDDPVAAAFFTGELRGVGYRKRVRLALSGEPAFQRRARRAADAIAALSDGAPVPDRARRRVAGAGAAYAPERGEVTA